MRLTLADLDGCVDRALRRIESSLATYAGGSTLRRTELASDVRTNLQLLLRILVERREPTTAELGWYRDLGFRRARQGIAHTDVVRAGHISQATVWERLTAAAAQVGGTCAAELLREAARMWALFDRVISTSSAGHAEAVCHRALAVRQSALALLRHLRDGASPDGADTLDAESAARDLGLDPRGDFVVAVLPEEPAELAADLAEELLGRGAVVVVDEPARATVLVQPHKGAVPGAADDAGVADLVRRLAGRGPVGVGLRRRGLAGARLSLADAEAALAAATALGDAVVDFRSDWLVALALSAREAHAPLLEPVVAVLADVDLRETVAAHLRSAGSFAATGRRLGVHANTVAYRLRQVAERSGADPRTPAGQALLHVALPLTLAEAADEGDAGDANGAAG